MDPQQLPQQQIQQPRHAKIVPAIVIVLLIVAIGYVFLKTSQSPANTPSLESGNATSQSGMVVVENTPAVNGAIPVPEGFPQSIPLEEGEIVESATTHYPDQNVRQLSLSYRSSKTMNQKYAEYKEYLNRTGYEIKEADANSPVKALFGTGRESNLSVVISNSGDSTLVQLSYLLK
ncbi:MAG: hypothetical protein Q8P21_01995 [bacterium]|nr:hypothetical protein [bacterium]